MIEQKKQTNRPPFVGSNHYDWRMIFSSATNTWSWVSDEETLLGIFTGKLEILMTVSAVFSGIVACTTKRAITSPNSTRQAATINLSKKK